MNTEVIHGRGFDAAVIRTGRQKTATVKVVEGKVSVVVPRTTSKAEVESLVDRKTQWIKEKLHLQRSQVPVRPKEYVSGESFSCLGKNYRLKIRIGAEPSVILANGRLNVTVKPNDNAPDKIRASLVGWYKTRAAAKLREKVSRYAPVVGVQPASVSVKTFKSRWGSCHLSGDIYYNWRIIAAPTSVVDYVVVHELCHLLHHDHSPRFWSALAGVLPDYKTSRKWLKQHGSTLNISTNGIGIPHSHPGLSLLSPCGDSARAMDPPRAFTTRWR